VSRESAVMLSMASACRTRSADIVINARVATSPEKLQEYVEDALSAACDALGARAEIRQVQCFRPGRPTPTHRYVN
jgi:hypothetical protein